MPDLGVPELLIIAFVVVLLFGSKKLPGAAKSIGQSLKIFKDETKGLKGEHTDNAEQVPPTVIQPVQPVAAPVEAPLPPPVVPAPPVETPVPAPPVAAPVPASPVPAAPVPAAPGGQQTPPA